MDPSTIERQASRHPGAGRKRTPLQPKGRQVEPAALAEIETLLGERPRRRDLLLEHLHLIQDAYGCLAARHLAALAELMGLALTEVYEVASFYHNLDVVQDGEAAPPPVTVRVCESLTCAMLGADKLFEDLRAASNGRFRVLRCACLGQCDQAPAARVGAEVATHATPTEVLRHPGLDPGSRATALDPDFRRGDTGETVSDHYRLLRDCLAGHRTPDEIIDLLEASGLRGLGGAGFPTGRKWRAVRAEPGPRLMAVNGDESEPGTFKDRYYLERDPQRFLEGALIGAWAMEASELYIYIRDEYAAIRQSLESCVADAKAAGLVRLPVHLRRGAGAYICGEESAMLESIEGKRPLPRHKPPYPSEVGLFGRPTLINNVETLYWVRDLVERGPDWFAGQGRRGRKGLRSFSVSGRVREPGVKLGPAGISVRELIDEYCGGMADGHNFKAFLPGGASGGILPASLGDLPLDFGTLEPHGCFIGSAAVIVLSDRDSIADAARNLMHFFKDESCGQCTPCRVGTEKALALMGATSWDRPLLQELSRCMTDASICGLGQAAANPVLSLFRHFPEEAP